MNGRNLTITLMTLAILLVGCGPSPGDGPPLDGTQWALVALGGEPPLPGTTPSAEFSGDQVSGSTGCNHYFGTYEVTGSDITIGDLAQTEMYCADPEGVMDQEAAFLAALASAARYRLTGAQLELLDSSGSVILAFGPPAAVAEAPTPTLPTPTAEATEVPPTPTADATGVPPTPTAKATEIPPPPAFEPPAGFKRYVDTGSGVSLWVPESWTVVEPGPHGGPTILMSYPQDKYVGGEGRKPGDTKCDLYIHPPGVHVADVVPQNRSDPPVTVVSEQEVVLHSGRAGKRFEVDSMGRFLSLVTEVNERAVVLACFGELAPFDEIAVTLGASE